MNTINASITPMRVCRIFGVPALFTPYRVSSATVHWGLYQYDLQALLNNPSEVFVLADHAEDFFYGTILTAQEIDLPRRSRIVPDGAFTMETRYCRPAEFEQEYGAAYCSSSLMPRHAALTLAAVVIFSIVNSFPAHKPVRCAGGKSRPLSSFTPQQSGGLWWTW